MNIIPVILSGGSGTRLWPLSRKSRPKQFLNFRSNHSLFQEAVLRCRSQVFDPRPIVVGACEHRFLLAENLLDIGVVGDIILEPVARNSAAAIAAACLQAVLRQRNALVLVLAADHIIPDAEAFFRAVDEASPHATTGNLVTFGVKPTRPATSYGYILPGEALEKTAKVARFVEKPPLEVALEYMSQGCLWNSGNFLFRADAFLEELKHHEPAVLDAVNRAFDRRVADLDFFRLERESFENAPSISVDCAVLERTSKALVLPVDYEWTDMGSWDSVAQVVEGDKNGNVLIGDAISMNSNNNIVHSEDQLTTLVSVNDLVVVSMRDVVLVASRLDSETVKALVANLRDDGRSEATEALRVHRPWGNYEQLDAGDGYKVKRIIVNPGGVLSLQRHQHRAEHWVVVEGKAEITIADKVVTLEPNQSVYVPSDTIHRLANRCKERVVLIETQTGDHLVEDDIVRLDDSYNRGQ